MAGEITEWTIDTMLWGKLALISKGDPVNSPVLLVHGFMDTAATFIPLLENLRDDYYYVAFDFPGHGKSDPFPPGGLVSHTYLIEVIRVVIDHMKWRHFIYLGHSLAFIFGCYYNTLYPGQIVKMINIDPTVTMPWHYYATHEYVMWATFYNASLVSDKKSTNPKTYKIPEAVSLLAYNRRLTEEQAQKVISRSLKHVGGDLYRFSWDPRVKNLPGLPVTAEVIYNVATSIKVPILNIHASEYNTVHLQEAIQFGRELYSKIQSGWKDATEVALKGGHDIHITHPEVCAMHIKHFLSRKNGKAKL